MGINELKVKSSPVALLKIKATSTALGREPVCIESHTSIKPSALSDT
jgi:hypothetical protein